MIQSVDSNTDLATESTTADTEFYQGTVQTPVTDTAQPNAVNNLNAIPNTNADIVSRKMRLEEARFKLEQKKAEHAIYMEIRREDFREREISKDDSVLLQKQSEHWMKTYWRPAMGWLYMAICAFDFIIGPVMSMTMPIILRGLGADNITYTPWESLTLSNGGLIHLAFGAILGITAWTRGQEKLSKLG
jgi:hypothetical protein